jgi:hypothetical protein
VEGENQHKSIRVWQELDINDIKKHLLLVDDMYGACASCKQIGLNYLKDKSCPACKTSFKYLATSLKNPASVTKILNRIKSDSLPFTLIDRDDYDRALAKDSIEGLFKS